MKLEHEAEEHNRMNLSGCGKVIVAGNDCVSHTLQRDIEHTCGTKQLVPKMYAVAWSSSLLDVHSELAKNLQTLVERDLRNGFYPHVAPPEASWDQHRRALLMFLIPQDISVLVVAL